MNKILFVFFMMSAINVFAMKKKILAKTKLYTIKYSPTKNVRLFQNNGKQIERVGDLIVPHNHKLKYAIINQAAQMCSVASKRGIFYYSLKTGNLVSCVILYQKSDSGKIIGICDHSSEQPEIRVKIKEDKESFLVFPVPVTSKYFS